MRARPAFPNRRLFHTTRVVAWVVFHTARVMHAAWITRITHALFVFHAAGAKGKQRQGGKYNDQNVSHDDILQRYLRHPFGVWSCQFAVSYSAVAQA